MTDKEKEKSDYSALYDAVGVDVKKEKKYGYGINLDEMAQAGLQVGHRVSYCHPKMKPYIQTIRGGIAVINLEKTAELMEEAFRFIEKLIAEKKILILVGTKVQMKNLVKNTAKECGLSYIDNRWIGGFLTNFETIKKRATFLKDLESKRASGEFEKYTKKEKAQFDKKIKDLGIKFGGVKNLERFPDAIFFLDMQKDIIGIKEARQKGVKIIALADANINPNLADYPIPANDDAISAVSYVLARLKTVLKK
ncbi:MAG: 30S ribosomal protein S2 [bacterium]